MWSTIRVQGTLGDQGDGWLDDELIGDPVRNRREIGARAYHECGGEEPLPARDKDRGFHVLDVGKALPLMEGGMATGVPPRADQLQFFSEKRMRPVWRTRDEIEANLSSRMTWE